MFSEDAKSSSSKSESESTGLGWCCFFWGEDLIFSLLIDKEKELSSFEIYGTLTWLRSGTERYLTISL